MANPLVELQRLGQSPWHDNISRGLLTSGKLKKMVAAGDITGLTSNPTIFEQAISQGDDYDAGVLAARAQGQGRRRHLRHARDRGHPRRRRRLRAGLQADGRRRRLRQHRGRAAIRGRHRSDRQGSAPPLEDGRAPEPDGEDPRDRRGRAGDRTLHRRRSQHQRDPDLLARALRRGDGSLHRRPRKRAAAKKPIDRIASVASFFVSRVDGAVDKQLETKIKETGPDQQVAAEAAAREVGHRQRQARLRRLPEEVRHRALRGPAAQGRAPRNGRSGRAPPPRTPPTPDTYYVEALIGPDTVDTMPPATIVAYKDHGKPALRLEQGMDEAAAVLQRHRGRRDQHGRGHAEARGRRRRVVRQVLRVADRRRVGLARGAAAHRSHDGEARTRRARRQSDARQDGRGEAPRAPLEAGPDALEGRRRRAPGGDQDPHGLARRRRPDAHQGRRALRPSPTEIRKVGFTRAVLCGMGGSSLAPRCCAGPSASPRAPATSRCLDSTDPAAVATLEHWSDPGKTLYIVSSKSGGTTEPKRLLPVLLRQASAPCTARTPASTSSQSPIPGPRWRSAPASTASAASS